MRKLFVAEMSADGCGVLEAGIYLDEISVALLFRERIDALLPIIQILR